MKKYLLILLIFILMLSSCKKKDNDDNKNNNGNEELILERIDISLDKETIYIGEVATLNINFYPDINEDYVINILDNLEDKDVAANEGLTFKGLNEGKVYISVYSSTNPNIYDSITLNVLHPLLEENIFEATEIVGIYGSNASTMYEINYQIKNTKSFVLLTTIDDTNWEHYNTYYGDGFYFEQIDDRLQASFYPRNVWHVSIDDLSPGTSYMYKIDNGDGSYSKIYKFKTADNTSNTTFLFLTDNHYYYQTDGTLSSAAVSEETIKNAYKYNPNISFIVGGGDRVDHGGNDTNWKTYFKYANSLTDFPFIDTPGNHEYYSNLPASGNIYFDIYSAGGDNGADGLKGSTCYFKHNDTLIIMMDDSTNTGYTSQMNWVANLLETIDYKYSILVFHKPCNIPGSQDYNPDIMKLCDKYSVDLVLCGHYHSQNVKQNYYNEEETSDPYLGTTYFIGTFSGIKSASTPSNAINEARGYIVDINDEAINIQIILANGTLKNKYVITNRTTSEVIEASKDELEKSVSFTTDEENNKVIFNLSKAFYGNVKKVFVKETYRNKINEYMVFPSPSYDKFILDNLTDKYDYHFELTILYNDDTTTTLNFDWNRHQDINLRTSSLYDTIASISFNPLDDNYKYLINNYKIYVNDELVSTIPYLEHGVVNDSYIFKDLIPSTTYNVDLYFYNFDDEIMFIYHLKFSTTS